MIRSFVAVRARSFLIAVVAALVVTGAVTLAHPAAAAGPGTNYAIDDQFTSSRTSRWPPDRFDKIIHFGAYSQPGRVYDRSDGAVRRTGDWNQLQSRPTE